MKQQPNLTAKIIAAVLMAPIILIVLITVFGALFGNSDKKLDQWRESQAYKAEAIQDSMIRGAK